MVRDPDSDFNRLAAQIDRRTDRESRRPGATQRVIKGGDLFDEPIPALDVDLDSGVFDVFEVALDGSLAPLRPITDNRGAEPKASASDIMETLREVRARPGHRLGAGTNRDASRPMRRGHNEEILQPVLVRPGAAQRVIKGGDLFDEPIPALDVDLDSGVFDGESYTWRATLRSGRFARRAVCLYLHPTPSANLSVLELIPAARRRFVGRGFVRRGVKAVDMLGRRLHRLSLTASTVTACR